MLLRRLKKRINRHALQILPGRTMRCQPERPLFTFSFDDFPVSAWKTGGRILAEHGCRGTYYFSMALLGKPSPVGTLCNSNHLRAIAMHNHELGCHTYAHELCSEVSTESLRQSIENNRKEFLKLGLATAPLTFAYPQGKVTPAARRVIAEHFRAGRTIVPGINFGRIDLDLLKANSIYSWYNKLAHYEQLILENVKRVGWLIFYTHDIGDSPSKYGCTPEMFQKVVQLVMKQKGSVVTLNEGLDIIENRSDNEMRIRSAA